MTELLSKPLAVAFGSISRNWVPHVSILRRGKLQLSTVLCQGTNSVVLNEQGFELGL